MHFIKNTYPQNLFIRDAYYNYRIENGTIAKTDVVLRELANVSTIVQRCPSMWHEKNEPNVHTLCVASSSSSSARHIHTT